MITEDQLTKVGLSSKQAQIYLALLEGGPSFLYQIGGKAKIKRTTLYPIIEKMVGKDLVGVEMKEKRKRYFAKDPEKLLLKMREQRNFLEALMPQLVNLYEKSTGGSRIQVYETKEGLKRALEDLIMAKPGGELLAIDAGVRQAMRIGFDFWKELLAKKRKLRIPSRTIVPSDELEDFMIRDHKIQIRTSNKLIGLKMMVYLYSNKAIIIVPREPLCVMIENKVITEGLGQIFEVLWKRSKTVFRYK